MNEAQVNDWMKSMNKSSVLLIGNSRVTQLLSATVNVTE